ncbi:MAG: ribosome biogenesis GTP-binding protein YihA/YsxC, partial [Deltaproteobacteria bacterium]|nr:ribosome biogenesis GTP-binding protein YihA/YsxC [Deltaproteobacteria bacterium]
MSDLDSNLYTLSLKGTFYTLEQINELCQGQNPDLYPDLPQIAFAGRSNVGKSSLINALGGRKGLAKVSATPGKTASINFYLAQNQNPAFKNFYLVDLPGYGYAKRSKAERAKWADLINAYLQNSHRLLALCVLLDCRLEPQDADLELLAFARSLKLKLLPLLTKADKCGANEQAGRQNQWKKLLAGQSPLLTSAVQ